MADDYLELVDQLKGIKTKNHAKFVAIMKERDEAGKDLIMSNVFDNGFLLLSDEVKALQSQEHITKADIEFIKRQKAVLRKQEI